MSIEDLDKKFGHFCQYCSRYDYGTCTFDDELVGVYDGWNCICFEWDRTAIKMLEGAEIFGDKVPNVWKKWYEKQN